jgi:hypothetical protein
MNAMAMPWQLAQAKRPKRSEPRPLVEQLPRLDIGDLVRLKVFPSNWHTHRTYELCFRWPWLRTLTVSLAFIEANHVSGYTQRIALKWIKTGFGGNWKPRPAFICSKCQQPRMRLYCRFGSLACKRCHGAIHASQVCDKHSRPALQASKLRNFLSWKSYMSQRNRQRIQARLRSLAAKPLPLATKRLKHEHIQYPSSNYATRGLMHWR